MTTDDGDRRRYQQETRERLAALEARFELVDTLARRQEAISTNLARESRRLDSHAQQITQLTSQDALIAGRLDRHSDQLMTLGNAETLRQERDKAREKLLNILRWWAGPIIILAALGAKNLKPEQLLGLMGAG